MSRFDTTASGRFGVQQFLRDKWTFCTIGCGYEALEDAQDALPTQVFTPSNYRVADRFTGHPIRVKNRNTRDGRERTE